MRITSSESCCNRGLSLLELPSGSQLVVCWWWYQHFSAKHVYMYISHVLVFFHIQVQNLVFAEGEYKLCYVANTEFLTTALYLECSFYRCMFNPAKGGEMTQLEYNNFLKPEEPF